MAATLEASHSAGFGLAIAVVNAGDALKAFGRSDGVPFLTVDVSINKAWTAASFGFSANVWNDFMANPKVAPLANHPRTTPVGGRYPLLRGGQIVGGLGISGVVSLVVV